MNTQTIRVAKEVNKTTLMYDDQPISIFWNGKWVHSNLKFRNLNEDTKYKTFRDYRTKARIDINLKTKTIGIMTFGSVKAVYRRDGEEQYYISSGGTYEFHHLDKEVEEPVEEPKEEPRAKKIPEDMNPITLVSVSFLFILAMLSMMISYMEVIR